MNLALSPRLRPGAKFPISGNMISRINLMDIKDPLKIPSIN